MKFLNALREAPLSLYVALASTAMLARPAAAQVADVLNPIAQVEAARTAAQATTLDAENAKGAAEKIADILIVWAAPIGLAIALLGFWLLYKANQDESGRASKGTALLTILLGGCMCVFSVITFVAVEYIIGTK